MYDNQMAKNVSDEVTSMLVMHIKNHLPSDMPELLVQCDGCKGQAWNNRLPLLFEEIFDVDSSK